MIPIKLTFYWSIERFKPLLMLYFANIHLWSATYGIRRGTYARQWRSISLPKFEVKVVVMPSVSIFALFCVIKQFPATYVVSVIYRLWDEYQFWHKVNGFGFNVAPKFAIKWIQIPWMQSLSDRNRIKIRRGRRRECIIHPPILALLFPKIARTCVVLHLDLMSQNPENRTIFDQNNNKTLVSSFDTCTSMRMGKLGVVLSFLVAWQFIVRPAPFFLSLFVSSFTNAIKNKMFSLFESIVNACNGFF